MRTEKAIRRELSNYEYLRDDILKHPDWGDYKNVALYETAISALKFVLGKPELVECPNCHSQEELYWIGNMRTADCDCGYRYSGEFGWTAPLKEKENNG